VEEKDEKTQNDVIWRKYERLVGSVNKVANNVMTKILKKKREKRTWAWFQVGDLFYDEINCWSHKGNQLKYPSINEREGTCSPTANKFMKFWTLITPPTIAGSSHLQYALLKIEMNSVLKVFRVSRCDTSVISVLTHTAPPATYI
jgi:hypothetical protein